MTSLKHLLLASALVLGLTHSHADSPRTWTSSEGKSFEGSLQSATETTASVRRSDGRVFDIPLTNLSPDDQTFVQQVLNDMNREEGLSSGPFAELISDEWIQVPRETYGILFQIYGTSKLKRLKEPFPLFIHLHGAGSRADEVETGKVEIAPKMLAGEELYDDFPCLIIVPTCPAESNWSEQAGALESLIDALTNSLPIDRKRIYLSGYSMGSRGIGTLIERRPEFYAAGLLADGEAKMNWVDQTDTALWLTFSGERDLEGAKAFAEAYTAAGKTAHFEGFPDHIHNQIHWTLAKTDGVFAWCFSQARK
ncbi:MAG: hypothetical protein P1U58_08200 [Verrucomicrobiales bacterium]|nr:hypothetical protein [Verrucomicrobiales bacterium]